MAEIYELTGMLAIVPAFVGWRRRIG